MSAVGVTLWWDVRGLLAFLSFTLGVTVRRRVVFRAPFPGIRYFGGSAPA